MVNGLAVEPGLEAALLPPAAPGRGVELVGRPGFGELLALFLAPLPGAPGAKAGESSGHPGPEGLPGLPLVGAAGVGRASPPQMPAYPFQRMTPNRGMAEQVFDVQGGTRVEGHAPVLPPGAGDSSSATPSPRIMAEVPVLPAGAGEEGFTFRLAREAGAQALLRPAQGVAPAVGVSSPERGSGRRSDVPNPGLEDFVPRFLSEEGELMEGVTIPQQEESAVSVRPAPDTGGGSRAWSLLPSVGWAGEGGGGKEASGSPEREWIAERPRGSLTQTDEGTLVALFRDTGSLAAAPGEGISGAPAPGIHSVPTLLERVYQAIVREVEVFPGREQAALELGLEPPHLGPLGVRLLWTRGRVDLGIEARNPAVLEVLTSHLPLLQDLLLRAGVPLGEVRVLPGGQEGLRDKTRERRGDRVGGSDFRDGIRG